MSEQQAVYQAGEQPIPVEARELPLGVRLISFDEQSLQVAQSFARKVGTCVYEITKTVRGGQYKEYFVPAPSEDEYDTAE